MRHRANRFSSLAIFFPMCAGLLLPSLAGCARSGAHDPAALVFLIESNPTNLDPRFATDSRSQHLDGLLFSSLVERDDQMNIRNTR
jgi:ABC-type transport system substrate-binding protein